MKNMNRFLILFIMIGSILCACKNSTISDSSSEITNIHSKESCAIIHEKKVNEGDLFTEIFGNGIIPDLSDFGVDYSRFEYERSDLHSFISTSEWGDSTERPSYWIYRYLSKKNNDKEHTERCWNETIEIDESGRLCDFESHASYSQIEKYMENISDEKILTEEELNKKGDELVKILCENGETNFKDYKKTVTDYKYGIDLFYSNDKVEGRATDVYYITLFPNGDLKSLHAGYADICSDYSPYTLDTNAEELIEQYIEKRYGETSCKYYEYEIYDKKHTTFQSFNGKIYGRYSFLITFFYENASIEEVHEVCFEDASCGDVTNT